jgi:predicted Zn-dependent protease
MLSKAHHKQLLTLFIAACLLPACSVNPGGYSSRAARSVARDHGGATDNPQLEATADRLLEDLCTRLGPKVPIHPRITVLASDEPAAFAAEPRDVFVSEGLLKVASCDEVRAAIAHELGHLMESDGAGAASALAGETHLACPEARADRSAVHFLNEAGYECDAMRRLLLRLTTDPSIDEPLRDQLLHRVALLESHGG